MYAVIQTGGKQYRVEPGDRIRVERLSQEPGNQIEISNVLMVKDGAVATFGDPLIQDAKVRCTLVKNGKRRKVIVFKKKPRKGFQCKRGHRQQFSELRVDEITVSA